MENLILKKEYIAIENFMKHADNMKMTINQFIAACWDFIIEHWSFHNLRTTNIYYVVYHVLALTDKSKKVLIFANDLHNKIECEENYFDYVMLLSIYDLNLPYNMFFIADKIASVMNYFHFDVNRLSIVEKMIKDGCDKKYIMRQLYYQCNFVGYVLQSDCHDICFESDDSRNKLIRHLNTQTLLYSIYKKIWRYISDDEIRSKGFIDVYNPEVDECLINFINKFYDTRGIYSMDCLINYLVDPLPFIDKFGESIINLNNDKARTKIITKLTGTNVKINLYSSVKKEHLRQIVDAGMLNNIIFSPKLFFMLSDYELAEYFSYVDNVRFSFYDLIVSSGYSEKNVIDVISKIPCDKVTIEDMYIIKKFHMTALMRVIGDNFVSPTSNNKGIFNVMYRHKNYGDAKGNNGVYVIYNDLFVIERVILYGCDLTLVEVVCVPEDVIMKA